MLQLIVTYARLLEARDAGFVNIRNVFYTESSSATPFTVAAAFDRDSSRYFYVSQGSIPTTFAQDFPHAIRVDVINA